MPGFVACSTAVSLMCQALWQYRCQSDVPGFVAVLLSVSCTRLCSSTAVSLMSQALSGTAISLMCWALWSYFGQSDLSGFVVVLLSCHVQTYINFGDSHEYV